MAARLGGAPVLSGLLNGVHEQSQLVAQQEEEEGNERCSGGGGAGEERVRKRSARQKGKCETHMQKVTFLSPRVTLDHSLISQAAGEAVRGEGGARGFFPGGGRQAGSERVRAHASACGRMRASERYCC